MECGDHREVGAERHEDRLHDEHPEQGDRVDHLAPAEPADSGEDQ
jgi:hypothetical protein